MSIEDTPESNKLITNEELLDPVDPGLYETKKAKSIDDNGLVGCQDLCPKAKVGLGLIRRRQDLSAYTTPESISPA